MAITQEEIARRLKISQTVVSHALNGREKLVSPHTLKRVLDIMKRENYTPNRLAASLRSKRSNLIGVILANLRNPIFVERTHLFHSLGREAGYKIIMGSMEDYTENELDLINEFRSLQVDSLLVAGDPFPPRKYVQPLKDLMEDGVVLVSLYPIQGLSCPHVAVDNSSGMEAVMNHLFSLGHRQVAFAAYNRNHWSGRTRWDGIRRAYEAKGLALPADEDFYPPFGGMTKHLDRGYESAQAILKANLKRTHKYTAIVAMNDQVAIGAIRCLTDRQLSVPKDFSVVGFDGVHEGNFSNPRLTTVQVSQQKVAQEAFDTMVKLLNGKKHTVVHSLTPKLIVRESTGPAPDS